MKKIPQANTVIKWIATGAVAAVVSTAAFFSKFGDATTRGLVMVAAGVGILMFGGKKMGAFKAVPTGMIVAGGIHLAKQWLPKFGVKV